MQIAFSQVRKFSLLGAEIKKNLNSLEWHTFIIRHCALRFQCLYKTRYLSLILNAASSCLELWPINVTQVYDVVPWTLVLFLGNLL